MRRAARFFAMALQMDPQNATYLRKHEEAKRAEDLEEILGPTFGLMIYQEQLMRVGDEQGNTAAIIALRGEMSTLGPRVR